MHLCLSLYIYIFHSAIFSLFFFTIVFYLCFISLSFSVFTMCSIFILIITQFWTEIFDIVLQMNVSRSHTMSIMTEYFVDQEKYFYFILLGTNITICLTFVILIAIGTMLITFFQYIYGMFKIARYKNKNKSKN